MRNHNGFLSAAIIFAVLFSISPSSVLAQSATFSTSSYPLLGNTQVAADFNGDSKPDLAGSGLNAASVMLNNGDSTFLPKVDYPVVGQTQDLAAGDFNGDGKIDLVVTINMPEISLSLLTGNGDGTFNAPVNFPNTSGFDSPSVVATDLNNDGSLLHRALPGGGNHFCDAWQRRQNVSADARTRCWTTYALDDGRRF